MRIGITTSIATAIAIGVLVAAGGQTAATANLWMDTNGGTCTRSSTLIAYNDGASCGTFAAAYAAASNGDTVGVRGGTYAGVSFTGTKPIAFTVTSGETAHISGTLANSKSLWFQAASNITMNGPIVLDGVTSDGALWVKCSNDIILNYVSGHNFWIAEGDSRITLNHGDWGPVYGVPTFVSDSDSAVGNGSGTFTCSEQGDGTNRSIVLDHLHFFDDNYFTSTNWAGHPDCFQIFGAVDGFILRNSIIERCGADFMFLASDFGDMWNLLIENNVFRAVTADASWAMQIGWKAENAFNCSVVFRYNTVDTSVGGIQAASRINCATRGPGPSLVYGNVFTEGPGTGGDDCSAWGGWSYNVYEANQCGTNAQQGTVAFNDRPTSDVDTTYDYTPAAGSIAIGAGKPGSVTTDFPATDFAGNPRTSPPDAGAYER